MKKRGKAFLNDSHEEHGSVSWHVSTGKCGGIISNKVDAELRISDCYKVITLDFDCYKEKHISKRITKLDSLIEGLQDMKEALAEADQEIKSRRKFYY